MPADFRRRCRARLAGLAALLLSTLAQAGGVIYVATNGNDNTGTGTPGNPYASIQEAVRSASDGDLILVRPGTYSGRQRLDGIFPVGLTIRSEVPYQARLRNNDRVFTAYNSQGITVEGFDLAHSGPGANALVFHVQDLIGGAEATSRIVIRNNIIHDSFNNDILKINNGARGVRVEGNVFYNQTGSDEHIDVNSVDDVQIVGNVFFNDFAASGRPVTTNTSAYIVVKDSNEDDDDILGSTNVTVAANIFLNWQGSAGSNFLLLGEDGKPYFEASQVQVENNLFIGNSPVGMRAAFGGKGVANVVFRHNTIVGDLPANGFALRLNTEGANLPVTNVQFYNNVWSDPTGTMNRFSNTPAGESSGTVLNNNLYWNGGAALPFNGNDVINPSNDPNAVTGNPQLGSQAGLVTPVWNSASGTFADGSSSISQVRELLISRYGEPAAGSAVIGQALASQVPSVDIRGTPRVPASGDLGAVQLENPNVLFRNGFEGF